MTGSPTAATTLRILRFLAAQAGPVPADRIASSLRLPRSTTYRVLAAMTDEGFVVHLPEERLFGLGAGAFEVGAHYVRQAPLERLSRLPLARLVDRVGESAHLAILHGRDVLYVIEERAPGRPPLVTDVGVRLPATATASGRAMLAALPAAQVRALFPGRAAFTATARDTATGSPTSLSALRALLSETRQRGYAVEHGEVSEGFASVAAAVLDHNGLPVASVAVTFDAASGAVGPDRERLARRVRGVADELSQRLRGRRTP